MNEAVKLVQEGNSPEDIDKAMRACAGHPMGPCKLLDLVGAKLPCMEWKPWKEILVTL